MFPLHHCCQSQTPRNAGHGRRNSVCLYRTGFLGLHYTWVKAGLQGRPPRPCHIRLQGSAATIGAPAILLEDSRPQAILKFHLPSSLDYRARHGLPVAYRGIRKCDNGEALGRKISTLVLICSIWVPNWAQILILANHLYKWNPKKHYFHHNFNTKIKIPHTRSGAKVLLSLFKV